VKSYLEALTLAWGASMLAVGPCSYLEMGFQNPPQLPPPVVGLGVVMAYLAYYII